MKTLTKNEIGAWCQDRSLIFDERGHLDFQESSHRLSISLEEKPTAVIALARALPLAWDWEKIIFDGALFWIKDSRIWGDLSDPVGETIIQRLRSSSGETDSVERRPGHLFKPSELIEMQAYFIIPLLFGWDAYMVPENRDHFVFVSHDQYVDVVSRTTKAHEELLDALEDWNPQVPGGWYTTPEGELKRIK